MISARDAKRLMRRSIPKFRNELLEHIETSIKSHICDGFMYYNVGDLTTATIEFAISELEKLGYTVSWFERNPHYKKDIQLKNWLEIKWATTEEK